MPVLTGHFATWHYIHTSTLTLQVIGQVVGVPAAANTKTCTHNSLNSTMVAFVETAHFIL